MGIVVTLGSFITDLVAWAPRLPHAAEALIGDDFGIFLGGKGINQAITAHRMGAQVTVIGRVGTDSFADGFFPILEQEGMDSQYVERDPHVGTGVSVLVIAPGGENFIVVNPRANLAVPAATVERALASIESQLVSAPHPGIFLTQCETSYASYETGLRRARTLGMTTILNAAPIPRDPLNDTFFSLVDILVVNEVEAGALSQVEVRSLESARPAAEELLKRGPRHVLITLGSQGCLWATSADDSAPVYRSLPVFPVQAIDSTAAGDTFCGALAASLSDGIAMDAALRRATAAAAITVTRKGAIAALPTTDEVDDLLNRLG